ncbi:MAG: sigma 54-interacting transcriptional regulator [Bryobacterales bacterium]|nr:sigma 54-interacting transcriptional regulator [Bryobacteraceae bacterium]MDW8356090.1 sigma 54-interacting transcriptional regulator [Bryobacterales bacterium]
MEPLKLALLLAAVDWRLGVLIFGEKGSGKSTAARALAQLLPGKAPFVEVPVGVTEERLLGGIDLEAAFSGQARLKPGLVQSAHGGVLFIDEVNLLPAPMTDALLDVLATGAYRLERDGFSMLTEAQFVLLGTMNPEEGTLRPQLLDRFALSAEVHAPVDPELRMQIVKMREEFDGSPTVFCGRFAPSEAALRQKVQSSRGRLGNIRVPEAVARHIAATAAANGVLSLRADLAMHRAARALAALEQREEATPEDVERVAPLILLHRQRIAASRQRPSPPPPALPRGDEGRGGSNPEERVFLPDPVAAPQVRAPGGGDGRASRDAGGSAAASGAAPSAALPTGPMDIFASIRKATAATASPRLDADHLVVRSRLRPEARCFLFVLDCSGSLAARRRISAAKGLAIGLLQQSSQQGCEVSVITFRGGEARILLPPCRDAELARQHLEYVPCGGRTPLAHALHLASSYPQDGLCLILFTDGQANVALHGADPWQEALQEASKLECPALIIDCSSEGEPRLAELAEALRGTMIRLEDCSTEKLLHLPGHRSAGARRP